MSEQYPGQYRDEAHRAIGEGLLKHMVQRGVVDPPPEPEDEPEGPSARANMEAAKEQHQANIALLAIGAMEQAQANAGRQGDLDAQGGGE